MKSVLKTSLHTVGLLLAGMVLLAPERAFAAKDACTLVTTDDAAAAIGEPVGPAQPESAYGPQGDGSVCKFKSSQGKGFRAKSLSVTVHYTTADITGSNRGIEDNLKSAGFKNVHQVSGVGDSAVWGTMSMLGKPTGELTILKGKHIMLVILLNGLADEAIALNRAKALAAKVLAKA